MSSSQEQLPDGKRGGVEGAQVTSHIPGVGGAIGRSGHILGIGTDELAGLSVDEVVGNKVAVTMVMHYYKQLVDENASLKNDEAEETAKAA